jgi:hypothetical protein
VRGEDGTQHGPAEPEPSDGRPPCFLGEDRSGGADEERADRGEEGGGERAPLQRGRARVRGRGEEERQREEPRGGAGEERVEREEEAGGDAEERVAAAARGRREVER